MNIRPGALLALSLALTAPAVSTAALIDLTTVGSSANVNGALFIVPQTNIISGLAYSIRSWRFPRQEVRRLNRGTTLRNRAKGSPKTQFNEDNGKTKDLLLSSVPLVTVNGIQVPPVHSGYQ